VLSRQLRRWDRGGQVNDQMEALARSMRHIASSIWNTSTCARAELQPLRLEFVCGLKISQGGEQGVIGGGAAARISHESK
jgi:hypothetical protein